MKEADTLLGCKNDISHTHHHSDQLSRRSHMASDHMSPECSFLNELEEEQKQQG